MTSRGSLLPVAWSLSRGRSRVVALAWSLSRGRSRVVALAWSLSRGGSRRGRSRVVALGVVALAWSLSCGHRSPRCFVRLRPLHFSLHRMDVIQPVSWSRDGRGVRILDQRELPAREVYRDLRTVDEVHDAILTLAVRGAPAIGIAGAMGMTLAIDGAERCADEVMNHLADAHARIRSARPTAVNLAWAVDRMIEAAHSAARSGADIPLVLHAEATSILDEDRAMCR